MWFLFSSQGSALAEIKRKVEEKSLAKRALQDEEHKAKMASIAAEKAKIEELKKERESRFDETRAKFVAYDAAIKAWPEKYRLLEGKYIENSEQLLTALEEIERLQALLDDLEKSEKNSKDIELLKENESKNLKTIESLKKDLARLRQTYDHNVEVFERERENYRNALKESQEKITPLKEVHIQDVKSNKVLHSRIASLEEALKASRASDEGSALKLKQLEEQRLKEQQDYETKLAELQKTHENLALAQGNKNNESLLSEVATLKDELESTRKENAEGEKKRSTELEMLKDSVKKTEAENAEKEAQLTLKIQEIAALDLTNKRLEGEARLTKQEIAKLIKTIAELEEKNTAYDEQIKQKESEYSAHINAVKTKNDELENQLNALRQTTITQEQFEQVMAQNKELVEKDTAYQSRIKELEDYIRAARKRVAYVLVNLVTNWQLYGTAVQFGPSTLSRLSKNRVELDNIIDQADVDEVFNTLKAERQRHVDVDPIKTELNKQYPSPNPIAIPKVEVQSQENAAGSPSRLDRVGTKRRQSDGSSSLGSSPSSTAPSRAPSPITNSPVSSVRSRTPSPPLLPNLNKPPSNSWRRP